MQATKEAFEAAYPEIEIQFVDLPSQDYSVKATTMLSGGDTTDVFDIMESQTLQQWVEQGFVESLNPYVEANGYDLSHYAGMEDYGYGSDGELYSLPFRSDYWLLFYNKNLFDAAGVDYPTNDMTWEEYYELAGKMTSGEGIDKIYGTHVQTWFSAVANWAVADGQYSLISGDYEPLRYFFELAQRLEESGYCMAYDELKAAGLHYSSAFYQGNIAMLPIGSWLIGMLISAKDKGTFDFDWSFVSVPHLDGVPAQSSFGSATAACINKNAQNKEDAWTFLQWRCGEEGAKAIAKVGVRPAYVSGEVAKAYSSVEGFPQDEGALTALEPSVVGMEWPPSALASEIKTVMEEEYSNIQSREISIDEGIQNMTDRVADILESSK